MLKGRCRYLTAQLRRQDYFRNADHHTRRRWITQGNSPGGRECAYNLESSILSSGKNLCPSARLFASARTTPIAGNGVTGRRTVGSPNRQKPLRFTTNASQPPA